VRTRTLQTAATQVAHNGGRIAVALEQLSAQTGARFGMRQFNTLATGRAQQLFAVFPGSNPKMASHVLVGIVTNGKKMLYDPQTGARVTTLADFGNFTAYPLIF